MKTMMRVATAATIAMLGALAPGVDAPVLADGLTDVTGTIRDAVTGEPISGLFVDVDFVHGPSSTSPAGSTYTAADGSYELHLGYSFAGQTFEMKVIDPHDRYATAYLAPAPIDVGAVNDVDFDLEIGGLIRGTVYRTDGGAAVSGACVRIVDLDGSRVLPSDDSLECSDATGRYRIRSLAAGDYLLSVVPTDRASFTPLVGVPITVEPGEVTEFHIAVEATPPTSITGVVVDEATGAPLSGVAMYASASIERTTRYWMGSTGPDGVFTFDVTGFGGAVLNMNLYDTTGRYVERSASAIAQPGYVEAITIGMTRGIHVTGTVFADELGPYSYACLTFYSPGNQSYGYACSDGIGSYISSPLAPGVYDVFADGSLPAYPRAFVGTVEVVAGAADIVADFVVARVRTRITGVVTDSETGLPIPGVQVAIEGALGSPRFDLATDADGVFSVDVQEHIFETTEYTVTVADPTGTYHGAGPFHVVVQQGYDEALGIPLDVVRTRLTGVVTDQWTSQPISGVDVVIEAVGSPEPPIVVVTDVDGEFSSDVQRFMGVTTRFRVRVIDPLGRYAPTSTFTLSVQQGYDEAIGITMFPQSTYTSSFAPRSVDPPPVINLARVSSTVNLVWTIRDAFGLRVGDRDVVESVTFVKSRCTDFAPLTAIKPASGVGRGVTVSKAGEFKFGWRSPAGSGCYALTIRLVDGSTLSAHFRLRA